MPRIEIELTSKRPDGTWTWRAAGARQPKGIVDGTLLPAGSKVADVLRADAEVDVDGTRVRAVFPPKGRKESASARLEVIGPPRPEALVTQERTRPDLPGPRQDTRARARGERAPERPRRERDVADRSRRDSRPRRPDHPAEGAPDRGERRARPPARPAAPARPPARRLQPGRAHRQALVATLPPEQRPIAEQLLRGGLAAVRQAVDEQNARARAAGEPEIKADALVALAEELVPSVRAAEWRDRAEAAVSDPETLSLRDLRTVVAGAGAARDDEARALAARLREVLDRRSAAERQEWLDQIDASLVEGRVVRALRLSSRPPEPGQRFPSELAARLAAAASKALTPTSSTERWLAVLEAVAASPVRKAVQPEGLPSDADAAFLKTAGAARDKVPAVAALLPDGTRTQAGPPPRRARSAPKPPPGIPERVDTSAEQAPAGVTTAQPAPGESVATDSAPAESAPADSAPADTAPTDSAAEQVGHGEADAAHSPAQSEVAPSGRRA